MQLVDAYREGLTHRVAMVAILNSEAQILLQVRGENILWPNLWDISAAGHVEANKTYMQCAISETSEEVGIDITQQPCGNSLQRVAHFKSVETVIAGNDQRLQDVATVSRWNTLYVYQLPGGIDYRIDNTEVVEASWTELGVARQAIAEQPEEFREGAVYALQALYAVIDAGRLSTLQQ